MKCYIGVDIGTTHIKTAVLNQKGEVLALYKEFTPTEQDNYGECYNPEILWSIVWRQLTCCMREYREIEGIAVTGMAEAGLVVDKRLGIEKSCVIPWFDKRTVAYTEQLTEEEERCNYEVTGLRNSFKYGIYKYIWILEHHNLKKEDTMWLSVCDYVVWKLTGRLVTDPTFAARTYVYDIRHGRWDEVRIKSMGLTPDQFPEVVSSGECVGIWDEYGIPVALCGHDHICCAYGAVTEPGQLCNSMGTAETYIDIVESWPEDDYDSGLVYGPFVDGSRYFALANFSSSGQSVEWLRKNLQEKELSYEDFTQIIKTADQEPGGIMYYPYLSGIGTPLFAADAAAAFLGIRLQHGRNDMIKAVIEGICYHSRWILETCFSLDEKAELVCIGGAVQSDSWMQYKANILNRRILVPEVAEGAIRGAVALLIWKNEGIREGLIQTGQNCTVYEPDGRLAGLYHETYEQRYKKLIPAVCGQ